jgi:GNAT superfamily N-acetyltransferase
MSVEFRPFQKGDETAFRALNEAWIVKLFAMEPQDFVVLADPETYIVKKGGHVLMGFEGDEAVACCALIPREAGCFELGKMAVAEARRGQGIGRKLVAYTVARARDIGAKRLYLESNTKLPNAVHVYESTGFRHLPPERVVPSPYARSNVYMEMWL